ncbi:MAG TPA: SseB family protein [Pirellulales bacterium]
MDIVAMTAEEFVPRNKLEVMLVNARAGRSSPRELAVVLVSSDVAIPSSEVNAEGSRFNPIVLGKAGVQMVAVFTDMERSKSLQEPASFVVVMKGSELLKLLPAGFGIAVNPGLSACCEISAAGAEEIRRDLCGGQGGTRDRPSASRSARSRLAAFLRRLIPSPREEQ